MLTLFRQTPDERIPGKAGRTATNRAVVDDLATCILAACTRARILTLLADASLVLGTLGANDTFRTTTGRSSDKTGLARANRVPVDFATQAIGSTRGQRTRIQGFVLLYKGVFTTVSVRV